MKKEFWLFRRGFKVSINIFSGFGLSIEFIRGPWKEDPFK
jgi:hypothetical protein